MIAASSERLSATVLERRELSLDVLLLRFRVVESQRLQWRPGQYIEITPERLAEVRIPYSIASAPERERPNEFELIVSTVGGRDVLAALTPGSVVHLSEPRGSFCFRDAGAPSLLVGIGTGLAPLRAMLQAGLASVTPKPMTLLIGARTEEHLLFRDEFRELAQRHPEFRFEPTLSRPSAAWRGRVGRVQEHLGSVLEALPGAAVYLCGSVPMVAECVAKLVGPLGVDRARVHSEAH